MRYREPEITDADRERIADRVAEGFTSGIEDDEQYRVTWEVSMKKICTLCDGTGTMAIDESDGEGHIMRGVGSEICDCQKDINHNEEE